jgi:hypothetical protein
MKRVSITASLAVLALAAGAVSAQASCYQPLNGKQMTASQLPAMTIPFPSFSSKPNSSAVNSIVGLWHAVHKVNGGGLFFESFDLWNEDGTEIEDANIPPATGNICLGVWQSTGRTITLYHRAWTYKTDGVTPTGTLVLTATDKVELGGNRFHGPFDAKFYNTKGKLLQELQGVTTATRLTPTQ